MEQRVAGRQRSLTRPLPVSLTKRWSDAAVIDAAMAAVSDAINENSRYAGFDLDHIGPMSAYFILVVSRAMVTPLSPFQRSSHA
jgi:hypothetical protein